MSLIQLKVVRRRRVNKLKGKQNQIIRFTTIEGKTTNHRRQGPKTIKGKEPRL